MVIEVNKRKIELEKEMIKRKNRKLKCDICSKYKFYDLNQIKMRLFVANIVIKWYVLGVKTNMAF